MKNLSNVRIDHPNIQEITYPYSQKTYEKISLETLVREATLKHKIGGYCLEVLKGHAPKKIEKECIPYLNAFNDWKDKEKPKLIFNKACLYDDILKYKGDCGFVVTLGKSKEKILLDVQTNSIFRSEWPLQLAASRKLLSQNNIFVKKAMILQLDKSDLKIRVFQNKDLVQNWKIFNGLLSGYHYFLMLSNDAKR